ncbi:hypothetical protein [Kitasatospora sp. NPDC088346]|uniref:hypothetical protein n=1 Tax=Kitasatospora sp. NPDC088346 TaxID=3364073 RepID=UPI003815B038
MPHAENQPTRVADRPTTRHTAPTAAERARTILQFASSVVVDVPGIELVNRPGILLDARFEFHRPVTVPDELPEAMHRLFAGLRH